MRDTELMAKWFDDIAAAVRRRVAGLDDAALEWRAGEIDALLAIRERAPQHASA